MSVPRIPGMEAYPDLLKRYEAAYRAAETRSKCGACGRMAVLRAFMHRLEERRRRDK